MELKQLPQRPAAQRAARRASGSPMPPAAAEFSANEDASSGSGLAEASPQAADAADDDEVLLVGGSSDEVGARTVPLALPCCVPLATSLRYAAGRAALMRCVPAIQCRVCLRSPHSAAGEVVLLGSCTSLLCCCQVLAAKLVACCCRVRSALRRMWTPPGTLTTRPPSGRRSGAGPAGTGEAAEAATLLRWGMRPCMASMQRVEGQPFLWLFVACLPCSPSCLGS